MEFTPSDNDFTYYASIIDKAYYDNFASDSEYIQDDLDYFGLLAENQQKELSQLIAELTKKGRQKPTFEKLTPDTEYIAYAFGVNTDGKVTSDLFKEPFKTPLPGASENKLTLSVTKVGADGAVIGTGTTTKDPYVLDVWEASKLKGMTDEQITNTVLKAYSAEELASITETGATQLDLQGRLEAATDYIALVFGYENGIVTTALTKQSFTTKPGGWVECAFPFTKEVLNSRMATYRVTPSDETVPYYFMLLPADKLAETGSTDEAIVACIMDKLREEADVWGMTLEAALPYLLFRGEKSETYLELTPETDYYLCAAGLSLKGEVITDIARSEKITTPAVSAATVSFGEPTIDALTVTVPLSAGTGTPKWKAAAMFADYPFYTEGYLICHLLANVTTENPATLSLTVSEAGQSAYFFAVGLDADGNPGKLVKLEVPVK